MQYIRDDGAIHYRTSGPRDPDRATTPDEAMTLVFVHGGGLDGGMFAQQLVALDGHYRCVTLDLPGHGCSHRLSGRMDVAGAAHIVIGIMDRIGAARAVLVGQSIGSYVIQHAALRHPDRVAALVSIAGLPIQVPMHWLQLLMFRLLLPISRLLPENYLFRSAARQKAVTEPAQQYFLESMRRMGKAQFMFMLAGQLDAIALKVTDVPDKPLLITHGEHEMPRSLIAGNRRWHAGVPGSQYFEVPDAGHNANMDNPAAFNARLATFLAQLPR